MGCAGDLFKRWASLTTVPKPRIKRFIFRDLFGKEDFHWFVWYGPLGSGTGKRFGRFSDAIRWAKEWVYFESQILR